MTRHRYPGHIIVLDYTRAGVGTLLTLGPLTAIPVASIPGVVLSLLAVLFISFAGRTWVRYKTVVHLSDEKLAVTTLQYKTIFWQDVAALELRYFATRRDRSQGWMRLTLKSASTTLRLESTLEGFDSITRAAARAAAQQGLSLSPSTLENLRALDLPTDHFQKHRPAVNGVQ